MKKILIIASLAVFLTGTIVTFATVSNSNSPIQTELTDDDTTTSASEPSDSTNCPKKGESGEKKACCKKHEEAGCHKK